MANKVLEIPSPAMRHRAAELLRKSRGLQIVCMERRMKGLFVAHPSEREIQRSRKQMGVVALVHRDRDRLA